jgi:2-iminobutanoate/2-iminopropanoate deaminase
MRLVLAAALVALTSACASSRPQAPTVTSTPSPSDPDVQYLTPYGPPARPFSPAVRVGNMLYLAGQIGVRADASGQLVPGGIEAETRQTLENIKDVLQRSGSSMDRVVRCLVMMADMREWDRMNVVYAQFFPGPKPARSAFGASGLALGARVEIECMATVG